MHGCGNDYIYLDGFHGPLPRNPGELARQLSDRHRSIGSDGLILMLPGDAPDVQGRMRMFNSDGTEGAMCGNALRCFAMWLFQSGIADGTCQIAMHNRVVEARLVRSDPQRRSAVIRINMGQPEGIALPGEHDGNTHTEEVLSDVRVGQGAARLTRVSMGNPHAVLFVEDLDAVRFFECGPAIECHSAFPNRTNVEFVQRLNSHRAKVRVWERGSGETMACGSGACAVVVAGIIRGLFDRQEPVAVEMRGGELLIQWHRDGNVFLEGPAEEAFRGTTLVPPEH